MYMDSVEERREKREKRRDVRPLLFLIPSLLSKIDHMKLLTYRGAVLTWECDSNGHLNVMYYINRYELAGRNLIPKIGCVKSYMQSNNYGIAVIEQHIRYLQEVFEDDLLYIESSIKGHSRKVMTFFHELKNGTTDELVGTCEIKLVILDKIARKAVIIPDHIQKKLEEHMV